MRANQRLAQLRLDALSNELGASAGTIATYTDDLSCNLARLDENSHGLDDVGLEQIRDDVANLDTCGYAGFTVVVSAVLDRQTRGDTLSSKRFCTVQRRSINTRDRPRFSRNSTTIE